MLRRRLLSAALASFLLAVDVVLLTLFLNPEVAALREAHALVLSLFLPYWLGGTLLLLALAGLLGLVRVWPAELRPAVPGLLGPHGRRRAGRPHGRDRSRAPARRPGAAAGDR